MESAFDRGQSPPAGFWIRFGGRLGVDQMLEHFAEHDLNHLNQVR